MPRLSRTERKASHAGQPACITPIHEAVTTAVLNLMEGEVVSFSDIAGKAGHPRAARAAGAILSKSGDSLPWWRVVYANGHLPPCNPSLQAERLMAEGVQLRGFRIMASPLGRFRPPQNKTDT
ncbi:MAG: MGMT family protein [Rubripirellula sp.]|nr:MGMT family protein [Rubripirellula sp.]